MQFSHYQTAIFDFLQSGSGSGEVVANAGSGKTTTGVEAVRRIPRGMVQPNVVFLAFGKDIQLTLEDRLKGFATAKTYNAFGFGAIHDPVLKRYGSVTKYKNHDLLQAHFGKDENLMPIFPLISKIIGLFKANLMPVATPENVIEVVERYGLELSEEDEQFFDEIVEGVNHCLNPRHIERLGRLDFDDQIWYPIVRNLPIPKVDYLFVDEYQDTNAMQMELVMRAKNGHDGRVIVIGDPNQAIHFWRGAGSDSMEQFAAKMDATILPLSISYRSPLAIVDLVNKKYPHIPFEAWEGAIEGSVNETTQSKMMTTVQSGDMVLCRLNAPLVRPAMQLLKEGKKVIIKGKNIGDNMLTLIKQIEKKYLPNNLTDFLTDLDTHVQRETERLRATQRHASADDLEDKRDVIYAFADGEDTVDDIKNNITQLYSNDQAGVVFSSAHRSKGLEADNVYILHPELMPFKRARTAEAKKQEMNLAYVADTRAKKTLNYVVGE